MCMLAWCVCVCEAAYLSVDGRMKVLDVMDETQASPRPEMKENCPAYGNA